MSAWDEPRDCGACNRSFALSDYGHMGARALAERVDRGEAVDDAPLLTTCPECRGQPRAGSAEAAKAAVMMGGVAGNEERATRARYALIFGALLTIAGLAGIVMFGSEEAAELAPSAESHAADQLVFGIVIALGVAVLLAGFRLRRAG